MPTPLYEEYLRRCQKHSDINGHLPTLFELAKECQTIVEFGVRCGESTIAFLAGLEATTTPSSGVRGVHSYDVSQPSWPVPELGNGVAWDFKKSDTSTLPEIPDCDMFFMDTLHTAAQITAELKHGNRARKYLVFHDTTTNKDVGEGGQPGIWQPIMDFMAANPHWRVKAHYEHSNGLLVLERASP